MNQKATSVLLEDFLPINKIGPESAREKSLWRDHPFTAHLWWARRPLIAARAAVFAPAGATEAKTRSLARANAARFFERLCKHPLPPAVAAEAKRLVRSSGDSDRTDQSPLPRLLDMFAGGGAIPFEALRLGFQTFAVDLNPVAHIIQIATCRLPQQFGGKQSGEVGISNSTWSGLSEEVAHWGRHVRDRAWEALAEFYPHLAIDGTHEEPGLASISPSSAGLIPIGYLWTRLVTCKNPSCRSEVPLIRQSWLYKRPAECAALRLTLDANGRLESEVCTAPSEAKMPFDPSALSQAGNAACLKCGTVADIDYVKEQGWGGNISYRLIGIAYRRPAGSGRVYRAPSENDLLLTDESKIQARLDRLCGESGLTVPVETIAGLRGDSRENTLGITVRPYGITSWNKLFLNRQLLCLLQFASEIRQAHAQMLKQGYSEDRARAVATYLGCALDRLAENNSTICRWNAGAEKMQGTFGRQAIPMVWDFFETNPFGGSVGDWNSLMELELNAIRGALQTGNVPASVTRASATDLPYEDDTFDLIVTDPPYYDNVPYADLSDFFYVWLKRSIGHLYPEHFATELTPKKREAIADSGRHAGSKDRARQAYERMMSDAFKEAHRVLKPGGAMTVVYAHKTTLGWTTLVDSLRLSGFTVTQAWPLDTELRTRLRSRDSSALASSIFLIARKRDEVAVGDYESQVQPELGALVAERVDSLWELGISGADLVIACVGAGLRAFTRFSRVEYANGEEVPAERFLTEVETVVLETILQKLSKAVGGNGSRSRSLGGLDPATRFYVLWRYTYGAAELEAGEAIIFANGTHVELDGPLGLSTGSRALVDKKKGKYKLRDFAERGDDDDLGLPDEDTSEARPAIDVLHRLLWLLEKRPPLIADFIADANPSIDQLRLVAQALAGPALKGGELENVSPTAEQSALGKLLANWSSIVEGKVVIQDRRSGQQQLKL